MLLFVTADDLKRDLDQITLKIVGKASKRRGSYPFRYSDGVLPVWALKNL